MTGVPTCLQAEPRQLETYSSPAVGEPNASLPCLLGTGNLGHLKIKYGYMRCQDNQLPDLVSSWLGRAPQAQGEHSKPGRSPAITAGGCWDKQGTFQAEP